tara:strand:- start:177 stop:569 length:393 start_codon:yes stop_codon:yes gene_type:complete
VVTRTIIEVNQSMNNDQVFQVNLGIFMRNVRLGKRKTQTDVANAIKVTFQQIQKYEKGTNAISIFKLLTWWNFMKLDVSIGSVLAKCMGNHYLQQIFMNCADESAIERVKQQVINKQIDMKKFDAFIDIN